MDKIAGQYVDSPEVTPEMPRPSVERERHQKLQIVPISLIVGTTFRKTLCREGGERGGREARRLCGATLRTILGDTGVHYEEVAVYIASSGSR